MTPFGIFALFVVPALLFALGYGAVLLHERSSPARESSAGRAAAIAEAVSAKDAAMSDETREFIAKAYAALAGTHDRDRAKREEAQKAVEREVRMAAEKLGVRARLPDNS
jgi:hypothetical protein